MARILNLEQRLSVITTEAINSHITNDEDKFFDTKINVAKDVISNLFSETERSNHVILAASMQSGKTAVMNAICNMLELTGFDKEAHINKFIFATGMNDVQLKSQTMIRALSQLINANEENICTDLKKQNNKSRYYFLKNSDLAKGNISLKNSLILLDEVQYGSNENNNLTKFLQRNGCDWKNKTSLLSNNTFMVSVSATPFNEMVSDTINVKKIISIQKDDNYVGISQFIDNDMIYEATKDDIINGSIFNYIEETYNTIVKETQGCGIIYIRTRDFNVIKYNSFIQNKFEVLEIAANGSNIDYDLINERVDRMFNRYDYITSHNRTRVILKPIIVLIKGAFRAGVTIPTKHKDYTYMVYDYSTNPETTAQALLGRMCGYRNINESYWKRTKFYVNKKLSEQYANWEKDYTNKHNIPCEKTKFQWVDENYQGGFVEVSSKSCGNIAINLSDDEISELYLFNKTVGRGETCGSIKQILDVLLPKHNINDFHYNYVGETHLKGKNNYARSSQIRRFESFTEDCSVFQFRPHKISAFMMENNGRTELTTEDIGKRALYVVLDATIVEDENSNLVIGGNKRLLLYNIEVAMRTKVADRKNMFKLHKCTDLNRTK